MTRCLVRRYPILRVPRSGPKRGKRRRVQLTSKIERVPGSSLMWFDPVGNPPSPLNALETPHRCDRVPQVGMENLLLSKDTQRRKSKCWRGSVRELPKGWSSQETCASLEPIELINSGQAELANLHETVSMYEHQQRAVRLGPCPGGWWLLSGAEENRITQTPVLSRDVPGTYLEATGVSEPPSSSSHLWS